MGLTSIKHQRDLIGPSDIKIGPGLGIVSLDTTAQTGLTVF